MGLDAQCYWKELKLGIAKIPKPRQGHKGVVFGNDICFFGGGNDGLLKDFSIFDCVNKSWHSPEISEKLPTGLAAYGMVRAGDNIIIFGGLNDSQFVTDQIYKFDTRNWSWETKNHYIEDMKSGPLPRFGHSFVLDESLANSSNYKAYLFGGLTNYYIEINRPGLEFLNDFYILDMNNEDCYIWKEVKYVGSPPSPRESHSCCFYNSYKTGRQLIIFGGTYNKQKYNDTYIFYIESSTWCFVSHVGEPPIPRSLHSYAVYNDKMFIFGGWTIRDNNDVGSKNKKIIIDSVYNNVDESFGKYVCTNTLGCFDIEKKVWIRTIMNYPKKTLSPSPRAGHYMAVVQNRIFMFGGKEGVKRKRLRSLTCVNDVWILEMEPVRTFPKIYLDNSSNYSLTIKWDSIFNSESYIIQIQPTKDNEVKNNIDKDRVNKTQDEALQQNMKNISDPNLNHEKIKQSGQIVESPKLKPGVSTQLPALKLVENIGSSINKLPYSIRNPSQNILTQMDNMGTEMSSINNIQNFNLSSLGLTVEELTKVVTFVTNSNGEMVAQIYYDQLKQIYENKRNLVNKPESTPSQLQWYDAGVEVNNRFEINQYIGANLNKSVEAPSQKMAYKLEPGCYYNIRIGCRNSFGTEMTEHVTFKTLETGSLGSLNAIKIMRKNEGVFIEWEYPTNNNSNTNALVYLAVTNINDDLVEPSYNFKLVYSGVNTSCLVTNEVLDLGYIDNSTSKPSFIFRLLAKDENQMGPATQIKLGIDIIV